jgi:hypothetical protein
MRFYCRACLFTDSLDLWQMELLFLRKRPGLVSWRTVWLENNRFPYMITSSSCRWENTQCLFTLRNAVHLEMKNSGQSMTNIKKKTTCWTGYWSKHQKWECVFRWGTHTLRMHSAPHSILHWVCVHLIDGTNWTLQNLSQIIATYVSQIAMSKNDNHKAWYIIVMYVVRVPGSEI